MEWVRLVLHAFSQFAKVFAKGGGGLIIETEGFLGDVKCVEEVAFGFWVAFEVLEKEGKGAVAVGEYFLIGD